jgi:phosphoribosylanthranilate isomerase
MFVKICGVTSHAAVEAAVAAGVDALGFVFAPSPREVAPERALELAAGVPPQVVRVAVLHHPSPAHFERVVAVFGPDWVQTDAEDFGRLAIPSETIALPVFRNGCVPAGARPARLLFEGARSGAGTTADWDEARRLAVEAELVLAGGLNADNVGPAIDYVRPWGVDVSSGVERAPGLKDPDKINEFVARVRALENYDVRGRGA